MSLYYTSDLVIGAEFDELVQVETIGTTNFSNYSLYYGVDGAGTYGGNILQEIAIGSAREFLRVKSTEDGYEWSSFNISGAGDLATWNSARWHNSSLVWDNNSQTWKALASGGATGVTDHGALTGLEDDDHSHYYNITRLANYTNIISGNSLSGQKAQNWILNTMSGNLDTRYGLSSSALSKYYLSSKGHFFTNSGAILGKVYASTQATTIVAYTTPSDLAGDNLTWNGTGLDATAGGGGDPSEFGYINPGTGTSGWASDTFSVSSNGNAAMAINVSAYDRISSNSISGQLAQYWIQNTYSSNADARYLQSGVVYTHLSSQAISGGGIRGKGYVYGIVDKDNTYTATLSDDVIVCSSNSGFTLTLPAVAGATGKIYHIKNAGAGTITVDGNGSETIDKLANQSIANQYDSMSVVCNGSEWYII